METKTHGPIEYKYLSGPKSGNKPYLILKRKKPTNKQIITEICPFCGTGHWHGSLPGHRVAHCATGSKESVTAEDGTILYQKDGYIIVNN